MKNIMLLHKNIPVLLFGFILVIFAGNSFGQNDQAFINHINSKLEVAERFATDKGFRKTHNNKVGKLATAAVDTLNMELDGGDSYFIVGVCDEDCSDMDMRILDSNDKQVADDQEDDNTPVLQYTPSQTSRFKLQIKMVKCGNPPCFYGVSVFAKGTSSNSGGSGSGIGPGSGSGVGSGSGSGVGSGGDSGSGAANPEMVRLVAQITKQLDIQKSKVIKEGFSQTHDNLIDVLDNNTKQSNYLELKANTTYIFAGVCDEDCADLDIKIYDSNDTQVASDTKDDDLPAVALKPSRTGKYKVDIIMAKCAKSPCIFGVGVYGK